ncbi:MAG: methyltransferase domain-containing protein [Acidimicrobiales bacterium]|nr:methyltransferase domain-containing protein [Acidimicrobiales bacterium]
MGWLKADATGPVVSMRNVPVFCNALYASAAEAVAAPRGDLELRFSPTTGYLWNEAFDPELVAYNPSYENSLHYSPRFQAFARELADRLIERYGLRGRRIVEIGSGEGNFLALLCERGDNRGVGYDPSFDPDRSKVVTSAQMQIVREYYPTDRPIDAALVLCQHVLEHVTDPASLIEGVRGSIPDDADTAVYFEVPDATYMVSELAVWDLIYEHHSYFAGPTLQHLFERSGFEVLEVDRTFGDQYLYLEARPAQPGTTAPPVDVAALTKLAERVTGFGEHVERLRRDWERRLGAMVGDGPVAVWGAGSKGVTFLNLIEAGAAVDHVVDINPNKWGLHLPGTGQAVVGPDALVGRGVRHVLVMNPLYVGEIAEQVAALGLDAEVIAVSD